MHDARRLVFAALERCAKARGGGGGAVSRNWLAQSLIEFASLVARVLGIDGVF